MRCSGPSTQYTLCLMSIVCVTMLCATVLLSYRGERGGARTCVAGPRVDLERVPGGRYSFHEKSWDRRYVLVCMCARMYVMCGVRHRVIRAERYALVCVALHGVRGFKIIYNPS